MTGARAVVTNDALVFRFLRTLRIRLMFKGNVCYDSSCTRNMRVKLRSSSSSERKLQVG